MRRLIVVSTLVLALLLGLGALRVEGQPASGGALGPDKQRETISSGVRVPIVIMSDPNVVEITPLLLHGLLPQGQEGGPEAKGTIHVSLRELAGGQGQVTPAALFVTCADAEVGTADGVAKARAAAETVCKKLEKRLMGLAVAKIETLKASIAASERHAAEARARLEKSLNERGQVHEQLQTLEIPPVAEVLREEVSKLSKQRLDLQVERVGFDARYEALVKRVAQIREELAKKDYASDPGIEALKLKVEACKANFLRITALSRTGQGPAAADLERARMDIGIAEAELVDRRSTLAWQAGGEELLVLNRQIAAVQTDKAAVDAKLAFISAALQRLQGPQVSKLLDAAWNDLPIQLASARSDLDKAAAEVRTLRQQIEDYRPPCIILLDRDNQRGQR